MGTEKIKMSPYDAERIAPPTPAEAAEMGLRVDSKEPAIQVTTRVKPAFAYAMDRLIERKIYSWKSRQEFLRAAIAHYIGTLEHEIQNDAVQLLIRREHYIRQQRGEQLAVRAAAEVAGATAQTVDMFLDAADTHNAIRALRDAKRYMEEIPFEKSRSDFRKYIHGDGTTWAATERSKFWERVLSGDLDLDDEDEAAEKARVF